jgi:hypothetical protein
MIVEYISNSELQDISNALVFLGDIPGAIEGLDLILTRSENATDKPWHQLKGYEADYIKGKLKELKMLIGGAANAKKQRSDETGADFFK